MTAQLANGGFKLKPKIVEDGFSIEEFVQNWKKQQENIDYQSAAPIGTKKYQTFCGT